MYIYTKCQQHVHFMEWDIFCKVIFIYSKEFTEKSPSDDVTSNGELQGTSKHSQKQVSDKNPEQSFSSLLERVSTEITQNRDKAGNWWPHKKEHCLSRSQRHVLRESVNIWIIQCIYWSLLLRHSTFWAGSVRTPESNLSGQSNKMVMLIIIIIIYKIIICATQ